MTPATFKPVSETVLAALIDGLAAYKRQGVVDPWVMDDGTEVEPLDVLLELWDWRHRGES